MKNLHRSLIICLTPLQMLIAEKVISLNPDKQFDLLVIALSDNEKYKHYYQRLSKSCENSLYYKASSSSFEFLEFIKQLKLNKLHIKYQNIYLASVDSRHIQYIISKSNKANIYTFDDGTANIMQNSLYYRDSKPPIWKRVIWRALGIKYYMGDIKNLSSTHYTIYKDISNIIDDTFYIDLFNKKLAATSTNKTVRIFLGQPLYEISTHYSSEFITKTIEDNNIDYYYPHPREKQLPKGNYEIINSNLIFEDYIIKFLEENPNTEAYVYSFTSSCLLNISQIDRVKPIYIYDDYLDSTLKDFYDLARDRLNISTIRIENI